MNAEYTPGAFALVVKRSRTGLGLFAGCVIPERACVAEYKGRTLFGDEWYSLRSRYLFVVDRTKVIDGSSRANLARYINHSCSPNCVPDIHRRRVFIRATRRIEAGEELGYDYGAEYFEEFIAPRGCRCASCDPPPPAECEIDHRRSSCGAAAPAENGERTALAPALNPLRTPV